MPENEYYDVSYSDDNENSIQFIDDNHSYEYIEDEEQELRQESNYVDEEQESRQENNYVDDENYYTIEIEDDDFEKDTIIA